jgi:hypothetical protein
MLNIDWYIEHPLDFEYKNYILLDYIQSVDKSYQICKVSPYLLWTEKLFNELDNFEKLRINFLKKTEKKYLSFDSGSIRILKTKIKEPEQIKIISDIVDFSKPILESKVKLGYKLLEKYPQILF